MNMLFHEFLAIFSLDSYFDMILEAAKYNEMVGEWQLKCIAYTGNNLQDVSKHLYIE